MLEEVRNTFFVTVFQILLDTYGKLLPKRFLKNDKVPKESLEFTLYLKIIGAYVYILKRIEEHGRLFAVKLQERRLQKILSIAHTTKWWGSYFLKNNISVKEIRNLTDFQCVPPITRFHLLDVAKEDLLTCPSTDPSILWRQTSGSTTGTPFVWGLNKTLLVVNVLPHFIKEMEISGFFLKRHWWRDFYIEYNHSTGSARSEFKWFSGGDFSVRSDDLEYDKKIRDLSQHIADLGGAVIRTSPSELPSLIQELRARDLHPPVLFLAIVGQMLDEGVRRLATDYLRCPIIVHYGTQETGPLAMECRDHHGFYHSFSERVIIEILDDRGQAVQLGTAGNVTITCLDNTVMPLIRYQPGDIGAFHCDTTCECENKSPLFEIKNRTTDVIHLSNGERRPAQEILRWFSREPFVSKARRIQVRQETLDTIVILLEVREHIPEKFITILRERLLLTYKGMLTIRIKQTSTIHQDGPKFKAFVPLKK